MFQIINYIKGGLLLGVALFLFASGWYYRGIYEDKLQLDAKVKAFDLGSEIVLDFEYELRDIERKTNEIFAEFNTDPTNSLSECVLSDSDVAFIDRLRTEFP